MKTTVDFLDAVKIRRDLPSDYALAKLLCIRPSAISNYRAGRSHFDEEIAVRVAEILEIDPMEVIASANYERAKTDTGRALWAGLLEKISEGFRTLVPLANARGACLRWV
ncbi:helix-turn-helix domain-containing protein [Pandoraea sp. XJJ-1]|uniref:helix-turn-helix domain-containing protein n=1 Tax=Pandoraea sp. XJJ-1 TaxID=3002643 RepID=UPI002280FBD7|nr:helix-turn-helix domain-containing protein [Pandoraea sp. XJJ-1]WAL84970.1 helix-turn-helix domain-containing protein [Pandoraea sp. XJJ-1]